jgi:hypothetical protein
MNTVRLLISVAVLVIGVSSWSAQAAITKTTLCQLAEATVNPAKDIADDCVGVLEGTTGGEINYKASDLNEDKPDPLHTSIGPVLGSPVAWTPGAFGKTGWVDVSKYECNKDESVCGSNALGFKVTNPADIVGGIVHWTTITPLNGEWVVMVKQAKMVVLYLFENLKSTTEGTINLNNLPANAGSYSHISLISRRGGEVPVPATLFLMAIGLALISMARKRGRA